MKESTTASNDHQATNTPASDIVTEATTTADEEIAEDVGDALGELGNLVGDLGF